MKASMRARRMARNHRRMKTPSKLNLVSLMDIFTILVFFLMVNNGDVEVLQSDKSIELPESVAEVKPEINLLIKVNGDDLIVQGRKVAGVQEILAAKEDTITALTKELKYQTSRRPEMTELELKEGRSVTIMGDQGIPYQLLKRVMTTCAAEDYRAISLAVNNVPANEPGAEMEI